MAINSIQLPDNTTQDIHDARLSSISELSIDSTPTANSNNLVKSGGVKSYVDERTTAKIITFVFQGSTYQAEEGMSWEEWVESSYNTSWFEAEDPYIVDSNGDYLSYNNISQLLTDKIIANATYGKTTSAYSPSTKVSVGGTTYAPASGTGIVSLPAYPSVPVTDVTVGGTSVVSSGTAVIPAIPTVPTIITTWPNNNSFNPNVVYQISGDVTGEKSVSLSLADLDETIPNHWYIEFNTGSTVPTINWAPSIVWNGGSAPTINASKHYEISILYDTSSIVWEGNSATEFSKAVYIETEKFASS